VTFARHNASAPIAEKFRVNLGPVNSAPTIAICLNSVLEADLQRLCEQKTVPTSTTLQIRYAHNRHLANSGRGPLSRRNHCLRDLPAHIGTKTVLESMVDWAFFLFTAYLLTVTHAQPRLAGGQPLIIIVIARREKAEASSFVNEGKTAAQCYRVSVKCWEAPARRRARFWRPAASFKVTLLRFPLRLFLAARHADLGENKAGRLPDLYRFCGSWLSSLKVRLAVVQRKIQPEGSASLWRHRR